MNIKKINVHNIIVRLILVELRNIRGYFISYLSLAFNVSNKDEYMLNILGVYLSET